MNAKIAALLWTASLSCSAVAIFFLHQMLWVPPLAEASTEGNILLARTVNSVNHRSAGSIAWADAEPGRRLQENDAIRAGDSSIAEIVFADDTRIVLQENSMVIIKALGTNEDGSLKGASLLLDEGQVNFVKKKKKRRNVVGLRQEPVKKKKIKKKKKKKKKSAAAVAGKAKTGKKLTPEARAARLKVAKTKVLRKKLGKKAFTEKLAERTGRKQEELLEMSAKELAEFEPEMEALYNEEIDAQEADELLGLEDPVFADEAFEGEEIFDPLTEDEREAQPAAEEDTEDLLVASADEEPELVDADAPEDEDYEYEEVEVEVEEEAEEEDEPAPVIKIETKNVAMDISNSEGSIKAGKEVAELSINKGAAKIETSKGVIKVNSKSSQGATLQVKKSEDKQEDIQVEAVEGEAELEVAGEVVEVAEDNNEGVVLSEKGEAKKVLIPEAPKLKSDNIRVSLGSFLQGEAQLRWTSVPAPEAAEAAPTYKVTFYDKGDIAKPLTTYETATNSLVAANLSPGEYLYTVATIQDSVVGKESIPKALKITLPPPPKLPNKKVEVADDKLAEAGPISDWKPVDDGAAANYRVRVYNKQDPKKIVAQKDVQDTQLALADLPPGDYTYNVSTLLMGYEGRPSKSREFTVIDRKLLVPPQADTAKSDKKLEFAGKSQSAKLVWKPTASGQSRYRLQVSRSKAFPKNRLLLDDVLETTEKQVALKSGTYYWRVAALAGEKTQGEFSQPEPLKVIKLIPPAVFVPNLMKYDLVYTELVDLEGKTEPENSVELKMVWAKDEKLQVGADGNYKHKVKLRRGRNKFTLAIRNPAGQVAERVHEFVYLPQQLAKSSTVKKKKEKIDEINAELGKAYQQLEQLRQEAMSDSSSAAASQKKAQQVEAVRDKLEAQVKKAINDLDAYIR